jgi:protoporphyrinogen oxidase
MKKIAVIGSGISGLSIAHCLKDRYNITIFESASKPGGLIKCECVDGNLYHTVGGHVFNSKRQDVLNWFWSFFDREKEFVKATRNASVVLSGKHIAYPVENHIYEMNDILQKKIIEDLFTLAINRDSISNNFEDFLKSRFGNTLYEIYFKPYNQKIWKQDLSTIPLDWLEGKLPMPTVEEIVYNNFRREKETQMVHSSFYYAKINGSQFIADRLAENLNIIYNTEIKHINRNEVNWIVNDETFDVIVYTGNVKNLPDIFSMEIIPDFTPELKNLTYHGTTSVLCAIEKNPYSWIYMPDDRHLSHRIICTGNFSVNNNASDTTSATVEFTDYLDKNAILDNLNRIPFSPQYITHQYTQCTYPVQTANTRITVGKIKDILEKQNIYLLGRFAEWEYYNMDAAMGAAIDLSKKFI